MNDNEKRNYSSNISTKNVRYDEYARLIESWKYDVSRSAFDESGGFVVTDKFHNMLKNDDKENIAVGFLIKKGYKVYLEDERSFISESKNPDGKLYKNIIEIKTINTAGKNTIKNKIENASKQGASVVVLYQNTEKMTRSYVESQIKLFKDKSPKLAKNKIEYVIVVGSSGNVHRHKIISGME